MWSIYLRYCHAAIVVIFVDLVLLIPNRLSLLAGDLFWQIIKQAEVKMQFEFLKSAGVLFLPHEKKNIYLVKIKTT